MRMRRIGLLLVVLLCVAMSATAEKVKLVIYSNTPADDPATYPLFQEYLREYEKLNPNVEIQDLGREHNRDKLLALLVSGSQIDMIAGPDINYFYDAGFIADVPQQLAAKLKRDLFPVAIEGGTIRGHFFGVPAQNNVMALFYNKRLLGEAGLPANPPTTWNNLAEMAKRLVIWNADGSMKRPGFYTQGKSKSDAWAIDMSATVMFLSEGGQIVDKNGKLAIDGPIMRNIINRYKEWFDSFMRFEYWNFDSGNGALMLGYSWQTANVKRTYMGGDPVAYKEDIALARVPAGSAGHVSMQFGNLYGVVKASKYQDEVWRLIDWLYTSKGRNGMTPMGHLMATRGYPPIHRNDIQAIPRFDDAHIYMGLIDNLQVATNPSKYAEYGLGSILCGTPIQNVINGKISPEQALSDTILAMQKAMDDYQKAWKK